MKGDIIYNDHELIQQIKNGEEAALRVLFTRYRRRMIRESYYILHDLAEAEDIVQEIFISLWSKREEINIHTAFQPYLLRAAWNESIKRLKTIKTRETRQHKYNYFSETIVNIQPFEREELAQLLEQALKDVPPAARRSFLLQYMGDLSQKTIASEQNISLQVVKNNVSLALKILRKLLHAAK